MKLVIFPFFKNLNKHFELKDSNENLEEEDDNSDEIKMNFGQRRINSTRRKNLLKGFDKQYSRVIKKIHNKEVDPLSELGPGISTYHHFLLMAFLLMLTLTCLHIPVFNIY